ncbi:MAG TPA: hypothetical protein VF520_03025 [Thermoleophilaceae bacterium]
MTAAAARVAESIAPAPPVRLPALERSAAAAGARDAGPAGPVRLRQPAVPRDFARVPTTARRCSCGAPIVAGGECAGCRARRLAAQRSGRAERAGSGDSMGHVRCDWQTGRNEVTVAREHVAGTNCVDVHERAHESDRDLVAACRGLHECVERGSRGDSVLPAGRSTARGFESTGMSTGDLCLSAYNDWHTKASSAFECDAYRAEVACIQTTIDSRCGSGPDRPRNIGMGIGAAVGAVGGAIGGAVLGADVLAPALNMSAEAAGWLFGAVGGVLGGLIGLGIGAAIGSIFGASRLPEEACNELRDPQFGALKDARDHVESECSGAAAGRSLPRPFGADGRINAPYIEGLLSPAAPAPRPTGGGAAKPTGALPPGSRGTRGVVATAGRAGRGPRSVPPDDGGPRR